MVREGARRGKEGEDEEMGGRCGAWGVGMGFRARPGAV